MFPSTQLHPQSRQQTIAYTALVEKPQQTIAELYARFGIELSLTYAHVLQKEQEKASLYKSKHAYSLKKFGLTQESLEKNTSRFCSISAFNDSPDALKKNFLPVNRMNSTSLQPQPRFIPLNVLDKLFSYDCIDPDKPIEGN